MTAFINQLGYKKLSQIIFEWHAADKASLFALFVVMEIVMHWLWCLFVWLRKDAFGSYIDMELFYPIWLGITVMGLFFWWMVGHLSRIKNDDERLDLWQVVLILAYTLYITVIIVVMGHSSLFSGVSLIGGAMLGMMLIRRKYVWRAFLWQVLLIILVTIVPYLGIRLPNLRLMTLDFILADRSSYVTYSEMIMIESAMATSIFKDGTLNWSSLDYLRRSSAFFWRSTHIYFSIPKAIFMVYVFRALLLILDKSKAEVLQHANQDELTKLNSRRYGLSKMQQTLVAATHGQDYSVILIDLDFFKNINDNYGHEVGDLVLREVSQVITTTISDTDLVSRYGGEEFLITLPDTAHDDAMAVAEKLRHNIGRHLIEVDDIGSVQITASLGLYTLTHTKLTAIKQEYASTMAQARMPKDSRRIPTKSRVKAKLKLSTASPLPSDVCQRLILKADRALYKAKELGRNQVVSANELMATGSTTKKSYGT